MWMKKSSGLTFFVAAVTLLLLALTVVGARQQTHHEDEEEPVRCIDYGSGMYPGNVVSWIPKETYLSTSKAFIRRPAPDFEANAVINGEFAHVKLSDYLGKYVVLFFYPNDFTFVCPTEIIAFSDRYEEFARLNTVVLAASVDSHFSHLAWINTRRSQGGLGKMNIPILSDPTHRISRDYGVYLEEEGHTLRGLFIIDTKGILRQITINDTPVGRDVDETLRLLQAFQYTDSHGEVCPAGWKPGDSTIKPDPKASLEFFAHVKDEC